MGHYESQVDYSQVTLANLSRRTKPLKVDHVLVVFVQRAWGETKSSSC